MKKSAYSVAEFIFAFAGMMVIVAGVFSFYFMRAEAAPTAVNCQNNLRQIGLGIHQYVQDYDEKYPLVNSGKHGLGWMVICQPYLHSTEIFQCPQESSGHIERTTDYFYNARMSRQNEFSLHRPTITILNGDGASNSAPNAAITRLPKGWTLNKKSPALRHLNSLNNAYAIDAQHQDGANYSFADGHVKWLRPENITNKKPAAGIATFEIS